MRRTASTRAPTQARSSALRLMGARKGSPLVSTPRMRSPTRRGRSLRTTISTSGNSGIFVAQRLGDRRELGDRQRLAAAHAVDARRGERLIDAIAVERRGEGVSQRFTPLVERRVHDLRKLPIA